MGAFDRNVDDIRLGAGGEFNELLLNDFIPRQASVVLGFDLNVRVLLLKAGNRLLTADLLLFGSGAAELDHDLFFSHGGCKDRHHQQHGQQQRNQFFHGFTLLLFFCRF